jgi:outer membrane protein TolC
VFQGFDVNLKFNQPELQITINRLKANELGVSVLDINNTLQSALSGRRFGYFIMNGKQYPVIAQVERSDRDEPMDLKSFYVRNNKGELIQLDNVVDMVETASPPTIYHFNRFKSATISAGLVQGKTIGDGIAEMKRIAAKVLDESFSTSLSGASRDYAESSSNTSFAFFLALALIFLVLAAQFESFVDPFIIITTVPLALAGAVMTLKLFGQTLNIFSQIGIIMLIGLVTKNGILIVEFANQKRRKGELKIPAAVDAAVARLRPHPDDHTGHHARRFTYCPRPLVRVVKAVYRWVLLSLVECYLLLFLLCLLCRPCIPSYHQKRKLPKMKRFSFLLFILFPVLANSQDRMLTVEEAIATALQNNYDIMLSKNDSITAAIDYSYRNAAFLPRLNANAGAVWNNIDTKQILADGSKRQSEGIKSNNISGQLALNWTLFDGFKMFATRDKAAEFVRLGGLNIKEQIVNTIASVITTYYNIARQKQLMKAIEELTGLNNERLKLAQYRLDIGAGTKPDVLQAQIDLNAQKAAILEQQKLIEELKEDLNRAMNVQPNTTYDVNDTIPLNMALSLGDIQNNIERSSPTLLIAKKNIDIAGLTLKERKAERFPTVTFNSAYNFNRNQNQTVINSFSTLYNRTRGFNYGLTATIPILNNFNNRRQIRQAQNDIIYKQLVYDNQRSLINLSLIKAYKDYIAAKKALALEEENILLAKENVNIIFQVYKLGSTTYIQLREAQRSLEDGYSRLITARYNTKLAETELLRLKGDIVR